MANWTLLRALGWTAKTRLYAAEMETIDTWLVKVPNFQDGSTHTGTGAVTLAGTGGFVCTAPFTGTKCQITVPTGKTIELTGSGAINAGASSTITGSSGAQILGAFRLGPDAVWTCNGSSGHVAQVVYGQYSTCTLQSGAGFTCNSGSIFTIGSGCTVAITVGGGGNPGSITIAGSGAININAVGQLNINTAFATLGSDAVLTCNGSSGHVAQVIFGQYSTCTVQSGSGITCNSGSVFTLGSGCFVTATIGGGGNAGSLTIGADGDVVRASGSTDTYQSGASLTCNDGAIVNLTIGKTNAGTVTHGGLSVEVHESSSSDTYDSGSELDLNGTIVRTGKVTLSGSGAWTAIRFANGSDGNVSVTGSATDFLSGSLTADHEWTYSDLGAQATVIHYLKAIDFKLTAKRGDGSKIVVLDPGLNNCQTAQIVWNGAGWTVGLVGQVVPVFPP